MPPDEPTDEEKLEQEPEDGQTPFQPADPQSGIVPPSDPTQPIDPVTDTHDDGALDDTHPATDTNIQKEELYDESTSGAAEVTDPQPKTDSNVDEPGPEFEDPNAPADDEDEDLPTAA